MLQDPVKKICHFGALSSLGPPIPFAQPRLLNEAQRARIEETLAPDADLHGLLRMPLGGPFLDADQRAAFGAYLKK